MVPVPLWRLRGALAGDPRRVGLEAPGGPHRTLPRLRRAWLAFYASAGGPTLKVFHIVYGRPIGPTFEAYFDRERAEAQLPEDNPYGAWVEETTVAELTDYFARQVAYLPKSYGPFRLEIR